MKKINPQALNAVIWIGDIFTAIGCLGLVLGLAGVFDFDNLAFGLSSGIRVVGSIAIAGCLLSAIGSGVLDFSKNKENTNV